MRTFFSRLATAAALFAAALFVLPSAVRAASPENAAASGTPAGATVDVSYLIPEVPAAVVLRPEALLASPLVRAMPGQERAKSIRRIETQLGLGLKQLEQAIMLIPPPPTRAEWTGENAKRREERSGFILRFSVPLDSVDGMIQLRKEAESLVIDGRKCFRHPYKKDWAWFEDGQTYVLVPEASLKRTLAARKGSGPLADVLSKVDAKHALIFALATEPMRERLKAIVQESKDGRGLMLTPLASLPEHLKWASFVYDVDGEQLARLTMEANDEDGAMALVSYVIVGRDLARSALAATRPDIEKGIGKAEAAQLIAILEALIAGIKTKDDGTRVTLTLKAPPAWNDVTGILRPIFERQAKEAQRIQRTFRLHQTFYAKQAYERADESALSDIKDKNGKPLLSWRVRLLPYLSTDLKPSDFRLDEPWDSEHNRRLIARMPFTFGDDPEGKTTIMMFAEDGEVLSSQRADRDAGKIVAVNVGDDKAVYWTKPDNLQINRDNPVVVLGKLPEGKFQVILHNGQVNEMDAGTDPEKLLSLILPAGYARRK